jgi:DHA2 family multidrug resistance protein
MPDQTESSQDESQGFHPGHNPWAVALTVTIATFMEVMDTSIANVALPHIAGGLSAGQDESTWVLTSYLVSNAIILPISAWLSTRFGRKRFYMSCVALFTVSSFLCGLAPSLGALIFFRILQGIGGGGLGPSEQAILADTFPTAKRGMAFAVYGMAVVLAPAIGPTLGGFITDHYSWRWIFYVNIPFGILSLFLTSFMVKDPPHMKKAQREIKRYPVDFVGLVLVGTGLGALQVVLDKGQRDDWFTSPFITSFTVLSICALLVFVVWEWRQKQPIVHLKLFKNPSFAVANLLMLTLGAVLFGSTVLLPQFVQVEMGYSAQQAGEVLSPGGFFILLLMPIVGLLVSRVDARYLIAFGFVISALALFHMTDLNLNLDYRTLMWWRVYQAAGLAFLFVPINTISYTGMPREASNQVSGLINLMRNMGGSIGISAVTTLVVRRQLVHENYLARNTFQANPHLQQLLAGMTARLQTRTGSVEATHQAYGRIYGLVQRQASVLAYIDVFWIMGTMCILAMGLLFFAKKSKPGQAPAAH